MILPRTWQNLVRPAMILPRSCKISHDLTKILARSCKISQDLGKILVKSCKIMRDLGKILPRSYQDLGSSCQDVQPGSTTNASLVTNPYWLAILQSPVITLTSRSLGDISATFLGSRTNTAPAPCSTTSLNLSIVSSARRAMTHRRVKVLPLTGLASMLSRALREPVYEDQPRQQKSELCTVGLITALGLRLVDKITSYWP